MGEKLEGIKSKRDNKEKKSRKIKLEFSDYVLFLANRIRAFLFCGKSKGLSHFYK